MFLRLLALEWKAFFRSANASRNIGVKIFLGFMALYFAVGFLFAGFTLYTALEEHAPGGEPIHLVNQFLLVWFLAELMLRFTLQSLPITDIRPLLLQPIKRNRIVHFLLSKSFFSFFNLLAPLVFIPFTAVNLSRSGYGAGQLVGWLVAVLAVMLTVNFLNLLIQKRFMDNLKALIPFLLVCAVLFALDYFNVFSIAAVFGAAFDYILLYPYLALIPVLLAVLAYVASFNVLAANFYLDGYIRGRSASYRQDNYAWTSRFGELAPFLQLDLRLIRRNKRPKNALYISLLFVLYGLIFYTNPAYENSAMLVFVGIFVTGMFMISFGQFVPAWDSSYFPMMMSQNIPLALYLESKAMLMYLSVIVLALLSIPYVYFGWHILFINLACALFNMGVNVPILLYAGSFNKKRIDMDKSQFLNYQGTGAAQWIVALPLILLPILIWGLCAWLLDKPTATAVLALLGLAGLLLKNVLMARIVNAYRKQKYVMIHGFKQQG